MTNTTGMVTTPMHTTRDTTTSATGMTMMMTSTTRKTLQEQHGIPTMVMCGTTSTTRTTTGKMKNKNHGGPTTGTTSGQSNMRPQPQQRPTTWLRFPISTTAKENITDHGKARAKAKANTGDHGKEKAKAKAKARCNRITRAHSKVTETKALVKAKAKVKVTKEKVASLVKMAAQNAALRTTPRTALGKGKPKEAKAKAVAPSSQESLTQLLKRKQQIFPKPLHFTRRPSSMPPTTRPLATSICKPLVLSTMTRKQAVSLWFRVATSVPRNSSKSPTTTITTSIATKPQRCSYSEISWSSPPRRIAISSRRRLHLISSQNRRQMPSNRSITTSRCHQPDLRAT